ncbi:MAG: outer membrane beta-barrel protein [Deltaproteobacteria bacterium]|nr:outer membrane beta-barrel protein [Deltaproteobacteria bacterium]
MNKIKQLITSSTFLITLLLALGSAQASTENHQLQISTDLGMISGSEGLGTSFDFAIEPEFFVMDKLSLSFRFDVTAGDLDSIYLGGRVRYYFDIPNHEKWNVYVGVGGGVVMSTNSGGNNFGDIAIPVVGIQYDLTDHIKLGSDFSFDILLGDNTAIAARIMPIQFRWAF